MRSRDIVVCEDPHEYRGPDGRLIPHVTRVLSATGITVDFERLASASPSLAATLVNAREIGQVFHQAAHYLDEQDLQWETVDSRIVPYLEAWMTCKSNLRLTSVVREQIVYHERDHFCGRLDGVFALPNEQRILIDLCLGDLGASAKRFQTAAYQAAYLSEYPEERIDQRWGVRLQPGRRVPYTIEAYEDWTDFPNFQAFVATYRCQAARRKDRT